MKIDRSRLKKSTSEVPVECQALIDKLRCCSHAELLEELKEIDTWTFGKCELYHWIDILDICDSILEEGAKRITPNNWILTCDLPENSEEKELLLWVLHFTTLLIEHSFSRHLYNSMEHLIALLASCDMNVVLGVLNLLYMFSKRSNFITRLNSDKRQALIRRLTHLAESWGGQESGFSLSDCCLNMPMSDYPPGSSTLHYEYYAEVPESNQAISGKTKYYSSLLTVMHIENLDKLNKTPAEIMNDIIERYPVPKEKQIMLFTHIRLAVNFPNYPIRLLCVQARLQALSVLAYSNALVENAHSLLYSGLLEELVEVVEYADPDLVEIRAAALRTLTSIIHLDRNPHFPKKPGSRLNMIIDVTGAASYHGFLPTLVRSCISTLTAPDADLNHHYCPFPLPLATALFSFLYHLASYEAGGEALVSCGMMESLLRVINWPGRELEHITFVTRAVRVIDLITNIEMQGFQTHGGLLSFINRLEMEVNVCRKEQPFEITFTNIRSQGQSDVPNQEEDVQVSSESDTLMANTEIVPASQVERDNSNNLAVMDVETVTCDLNLEDIEYPTDVNVGASTSRDCSGSCGLSKLPDYSAAKSGKTCLPQRAALLKSMLNFLKKAIQDTSFSDSIRHVMEGSLPTSLKHIISNAEYYGPSLFLLATDVVTVYVFQEPSLLSSLQDNGLTQVVLHALLVKDVPATREVLGSLPNVFSALCLNARGLGSFVLCEPFERLFKVLLSPVYLGAMRRRRSSDPIGDTASNLGNAMDELMRHQPTLKVDATFAIIKLLEELCVLGRDPKYVCWRAQSKLDVSPTPAPRPSGNNEGGSSDEEDEDEEEASTSSHPQREDSGGDTTTLNERTPIALIDYILNVMKFVDAILSNNSTDDHCREFVSQSGLPPLMSILGLPNLPVDYPVTTAAQAVATVCKSILNLSHEPQVLKIGLMQLSVVLDSLKPLHCPIDDPGSSVLLHELAVCTNLDTAFNTASATPLLHAMSAAHGYVVMFVHVCRTGQTEIRSLSISHWASELGLTVLRGLAKLYTSLVWESTLLLALCSEDIIPYDSKFGKEDMDRLLPSELRTDGESPWSNTSSDMGSNGMTSAMEALSTNDMDFFSEANSEIKDARNLPTVVQLKYIKPLLGASSRLGRALAELFGLLVKLCVGSPMRQRRGQQLTTAPAIPTPPARAVATALTELLVEGMTWKTLPHTPIAKFKLTFLICSVGFTSPMLFDEKKYPYHLMLQKFIQQNGQLAFFETFHWAITAGYRIDPGEGLEHPDLPEGTGEFLDAWLMLLEKMVNPKAILDSPHNITLKHGIICKAFDPLKYLLDIQRSAFEAVMLMWGKKPLLGFGPRMSESMLSILRHILRGEKIMMERLAKEKEPLAQANVEPSSSPGTNSSPSSSTEQTPSSSAVNTTRRRGDTDIPDVNADHLHQLMDMGFSREHCVEALLHTPSVEQATEYLLTNPSPPTRTTQNVSMDFDLTEEDQMLRAIAMSLGEKILADCDRKESLKQKKAKEDYDMLVIRKEVIDKFTRGALAACLNLLDMVPDTVYRVCELLIAITKRNGQKWRNDMLDTLIVDIGDKVDYLLNAIRAGHTTNDVVFELISSEAALKAAGRIHLFTLLFEGPVFQEMRVPCALVVERSRILPSLVQLLVQGQAALSQGDKMMTPRWLAPLLLLLDLLEKVAVLSRRKDAMLKVTNNVWRWFDLTSGKWTTYSVGNNKLINEAYWNGDSAVRLNCGRRRYIIHFNYMTQANEESGSRRPVTMSLSCREKTEGKDYPPKSEKKDDKETDKMEVEEHSLLDERERRKCTITCALETSDASLVVRACVGLLGIPVDRDTLHAVLRVCLRLTRYYENARIFVRLGGVRLLLKLTQVSSFTGFLTLSTLLIRHAIEEPNTLRQAMEKVIRTRTLSNIPPPYKEVLYLMRNTSSCVCRDPDAFLEVAREVLRVDLNLLSKRNEEEDHRLLVKTLPSRQNSALLMQEDVSAKVIKDLLDALIRPVSSEEYEVPSSHDQDGWEKDKSQRKNTVASPNLSVAQNPIQLVGHAERGGSASTSRHTADPLHQDVEDRDRNQTQENWRKSKDELSNSTPCNDDEKKKPLLPKSALLKILAEAVRSYSACAKLITDHSYSAGQTELVTEDCSALAFLLDKLLPINENENDRDCQSMARMLIAALASCNHSPDAQTALVCEVKAALLRSLSLPESTEKHVHIQHLASIISSMIDNCPPLLNQPPTPSIKIHQYSNIMNNIVKVMLRKGLLTDLARVSHYLDLSSPNIANSINSALKPLETLSRIVNQPFSTSTPKSGKVKPQGIVVEEATDHTGTTTSETTHAQGEETVEDAENTEHDISGAAESLDPTSESQVQDAEGDEAGLDVLDQLLERGGIGPNDDNILNAGYTVESESQANRMETDDVISSSIRSASTIPFGNENDTRDVDRVQSSDSDSGTNPSDDPDEEVNHVDEDEEDEDEEEDDGEDNEDEEEGGSGYDEDGLEFFESDEGLFRIPGLDRDNEDILMIQYSDPDPSGTGPNIPWNTNTFPLPFGIFEDPTNGNDNPALNPITPNHPLLMSRHNLDVSSIAGPRTQRGNRQRRYQYLQLNSRNPNPPVILQSICLEIIEEKPRQGLLTSGISGIRGKSVIAMPPCSVTVTLKLLGPGNHDLSLSASQPITSGYRESTRVVVMDNGMGLFANANSEEEQIDFVDQSGYLFGPSLTATLSNIPVSLWWWCEEGKLLDGDSQHDCVVATSSELVEMLEKQKAQELAQRKEKSKKKQEDDDSKKNKDDKDKKNSEEGEMEVASTSVCLDTRTLSASEMLATVDVASATESLAESIVESVLRPTIPSTQTPPSEGPDFSELTTGLLSSLSEILPTVSPPQNSYRGFPENESSPPQNPFQGFPESGTGPSFRGFPDSETSPPFPGFPDNETSPSFRGFPEREASPPQNPFHGYSEASPPRNPFHGYSEASPPQHSFRGFPDSETSPPQSPFAGFSESEEYGFRGYPDNEALHSETCPSGSVDQSGMGSMIVHDCNVEDLPTSQGHISATNTMLPSHTGSEDFDSDTTTPNASVLDMTLSPTVHNTEMCLTSAVGGGMLESPLNQTISLPDVCLTTPVGGRIIQTTVNPTTTSSDMCPAPYIGEHFFEIAPPDIGEGIFEIPVDHEGLNLQRDSLPPPLIPLEDVIQTNTSLRASSSFPHVGGSEPCTRSSLLPSPGTPVSHAPVTLSSSDSAPLNLQETMEYTRTQRNRLFSNTQSALSSLGVPNSLGEDAAESLDLEAAASWLRSHIEARTSQQQNHAGQGATGFDRSVVQQVSGNPSTTNAAEIPEGVDPSFLAALPDEMREEVIAEQLRLQRLRQRALQQATDTSPANITEVNPEFLAALPPAIQEEVLAQQRLEQQRQAAAAANPNDPVDAAAFFQNLQPSLRQAILTDMEDSQISVLPPDLAQEAQNLRREWEARNRQLMQERFFSHVSHSNSALSSILRNTGRVGSGRYAIHTVPQRAQWSPWNSRPDPHPGLTSLANGSLRMHSIRVTVDTAATRNSSGMPATSRTITSMRSGIVRGFPRYTRDSRLRGRQLLDHEALSCLLVMLFVDEPKLNTGRLHRVLRNLCYHGPTREWVIKALLSIMERCNDWRQDGGPLQRPKRMATRSQAHQSPVASTTTTPSWLNITMDAALGLRASVFNIVRHSGKRGSRSQETASITIHSQAAPIVFRHTLEVLISLAKSFPGYFLPLKNKDSDKDSTKDSYEVKTRASTSSSGLGSRASRSDQTNFWEILLKLDSLSTSKKGKSVARSHSVSGSNADEEPHASNFEASAFGQLVTMLSSPVVKRSYMLTDKLLRLLSLISIGLPEINPYVRRREAPETKKVEEKDESVPVAEQHLKLAIDVLTSKSCSEEGLEDATALLLNLSNCPDPTKDVILHLLLDGAMELANMVNCCIAALMRELKAMNRQLRREESEESTVVDRPNKGTLPDRFTNDNVIVTAPSKVKGGCDLQLPSMATLTTKTSSQAFFLRILKVIVQIRESVRVAHRRHRDNSESVDYFHADGSADEQISGPDESATSAAMDTSAPSSNEPRPPQGQLQPRDPEQTDSLEMPVTRPRKEEEETVLPTLSEQLPLDHLWETLSACLLELADTPDHHAVLVLQPAVEAFFLVHSTAAEEQRMAYEGREVRTVAEQDTRPRETAQPPEVAVIQPNVAPVSPLQSDSEGAGNPQPTSSYLNFSWETSPSPITLPPDQQKFLKFAETHRTVLNQILRQSTTHLADGPFAVLVDHTRVLDFDVKRRYFRSELDRMDEGIRREELAVHVRRSHVFEDSFRELHRRSADEWKNRFYIVFEGEEGQDAGGLLREWYVIISREIFNPMYALFTTSPGDRVTYMINSSSHCNPNHLCYFKFVGRVIAKAIYDNKLLECYFTRSFYKHILGILVKHTDMESEDYSFYQGLVYLMEHHVSDLGYDLTFSAEVQEFGVTDVRDLIPSGRNIPVCEQNKMDYIRLVCQMKMTGAIRKQINAFLEGFYDIIPKRLISIFNEQELELLISGMPNVDIEDLKANTEYHKYQPTSLQIQWFWRALRAFDQADRAKFLQFVTGTSKVPLQGFGALEGMNGVQKFQIHRDDRSTDRLPSAHTCFNQLDLPVYETYDKLRTYLLKAIHECSEGFGFA